MKALSRRRRSPLAVFAILLIGLLVTGGLYAVAAGTVNKADAAESNQSVTGDAESGEKLFAANCATCHGMSAEGSDSGPSLVGVGGAAVDFQVGTGRMPMQMQGPQAQIKPKQFDDQQTADLAAYVASLAPGPEVPSDEAVSSDGVSDEELAEGGTIFRVNCAMCHNAAAAGGALTRGKYAPTLKGVSEKHIYEAMVTGPQNMPVFNDSNVTPEQKKQVIAYLKHIETQGSPGGQGLGSLGPVAEGLFIWTAGLGLIIAFTIWITTRHS
ncbi:cytochrome c [Galactobacter sp.]|uniref:cytochrome bc1 complex diheme cytochrome c subunit n=1 Tax=Galactobacter sp. TaxID=2676125 RepID=UPI0025BAE277|nr:cytochrome c [Galactobacter sp.]